MTIILDGTQGTTTPGLYSNSTFTGTYVDGIVADYTTGLGRITVGSSDSFKIRNGGIVSPVDLLTIDSSGNGTLIGNLTLNNGAADGAQLTLNSSGYSAWNIDNYSGRLRAYYGATEYFTIDTSGNVGIGTSSPAVKLDIVGANNGDQIRFGNGRLYTFKTSNANTYDNSLLTLDSNSSVANYAWAISGSEKMRIDFNGNVGIGTTSPTTKLNVGGAYPTGYNSTLSQFVGSNVVQANGTGMVSISTNNATGADLGGSLGFGSYDSSISSPYPCAVISGRRESGTAGTYSGYFAVATTLSNGTIAERMRIDSSGNLLIGTTSNAGVGGFTVAPNTSVGAAQVNFNRNTNASGSTVIVFRDAGTLVGSISYTNTTTTYGTSSDYRLKENIAPMVGALDKVSQLKPVTYTWKADGSSGQGFIAHELQEIVPDCVTGKKDAVDEEGKPIYQGIDTSFLVATLTAAIQELNAKVESLEAQLKGN